MIASIRADFRAAADAIDAGNLDHESLSYTHILVEIGRVFVEHGQMSDVGVAAHLRRIADEDGAQ